jgi:polysaccharide biosynthesis protein PelC
MKEAGSNTMHKLSTLLIPLLALILSACSSIETSSDSKPLTASASWALLPMVNNTGEPQAGLRAEAIAETLLRIRGITTLRHYPAEMNPDSVFEPAQRKRTEEALSWARKERNRYAMTGTVDEWHYKVGVDGDPAVGITLQVLDLQNGQVLWTAVGAKTGWGRQSLAIVAQDLLQKMINDIPLSKAE